MMHRAWSSTVEVPFGFSMSYVKFQGHPALKIVEFDPNWAFPDCNSSLNLPMAMKCCIKAWNSKGEMLYCFPRSSIKFQGHTVQNISDFDPNWAFPDYRPVAAFKSLRFAFFLWPWNLGFQQYQFLGHFEHQKKSKFRSGVIFSKSFHWFHISIASHANCKCSCRCMENMGLRGRIRRPLCTPK